MARRRFLTLIFVIFIIAFSYFNLYSTKHHVDRVNHNKEVPIKNSSSEKDSFTNGHDYYDYEEIKFFGELEIEEVRKTRNKSGFGLII